MIRLFVFPEPTIITVRVEGELSAENLTRLATLVEEELWHPRHRKIAIDLGDVSIRDEVSLAWVEGLATRGIDVLALDPDASASLNRRAEQSCHARCNVFQRIVFRVSEHLETLPERLRKWLCLGVHALLPRQFWQTPDGRC